MKNSLENKKDAQYTLREPRPYVNLVEMLIGEVNERILSGGQDIREYHVALICKAITAKPFILDRTRPQLNTYLQLQQITL